MSAVVILIIWGTFFKLEKSANDGNGGKRESVWSSIQNKFNQAKNGILEFRTENGGGNAATAAKPEAFNLTLTDFAINMEKNTLSVNFLAQNNSLEILNFLRDGGKNLQLTDGSSQLLPTGEIFLKDRPTERFPQKILGKSSIAGTATFPVPANTAVTIKASDLYFLNSPDNLFDKTLNFSLVFPINKSTTPAAPRQ